jgi:hypothetical protein
MGGGDPEAAVDLPAFARKTAASDGTEYLVDKAEEKDMAYVAENSCVSCSKILAKGDIRVCPPRYIQDRDYYVSHGIVSRRYMCVPCYNSIRARSRERLHRSIASSRRRNSMLRSVIMGYMARR